MKCNLTLLIFIFFIFGGFVYSYSRNSSEYKEYQIGENEFNIIILYDDRFKKNLKEYGWERAAAVAQKHGYSYFVVESEKDGYFCKAPSTVPYEEQMPRNIYYDLIQSGNFTKEPVDFNDIREGKMYAAYVLEIQCFNEKTSKKARNVCDFVECEK